MMEIFEVYGQVDRQQPKVGTVGTDTGVKGRKGGLTFQHCSRTHPSFWAAAAGGKNSGRRN